MEFWVAAVIFVVSFFTSFVGSSVGGSGIIRIPLLMLFGVTPAASIGTSKLATVVGAPIAMREFHKKKFVKWKEVKYLIVPCFVGVIIGALITISLNPQFLETLIAVFILITIGFNIIKDRLKLSKLKHAKKLALLAFLPLFVYLGFLGAGAGSLISLFLMAFFGYKYLEATGTKLIFILVGAIGSAAVFFLAGAFDVEMFLLFISGGFLGNVLGPRFAIKKGNRFMTPIFYLVSAAMAIKLLFF